MSEREDYAAKECYISAESLLKFNRFYMGFHGTVTSSGIRSASSGFHFSDPCGHYGRYYGVTVLFNRVFAVTGGPFWTASLHHKIENRGHKDRNHKKR